LVPLSSQRLKSIDSLDNSLDLSRKADGDAPVQAYIAGMPGWKRDLGKRLDALIVRNVPNVRKAVKWNSPFYGIEGQGWFLGFHTFTQAPRAVSANVESCDAVSARASGEGSSPRTERLENPPHPDPLPASGERERTKIVALLSTVIMKPP
jgi:hypothetical protein